MNTEPMSTVKDGRKQKHFENEVVTIPKLFLSASGPVLLPE